VRARITILVLVALSALVVAALSIAVTLAASDPDKWPGWLQPYHRWGWWTVLGLMLTAAILATWQVARQTTGPAPTPSPTVEGDHREAAAGPDMSATTGQASRAGRDVADVTGGPGPTAGRDIITIITETASSLAPERNPGPRTRPAVPQARAEPSKISPPAESGLEPVDEETDLPSVEDDLRALEELKPLLHESVYVRFQERILFRRFRHLGS